MSKRLSILALALAVVFVAIPVRVWADPPHVPASTAHAPATAAPPPEGVVNVNAATEDELMRLPGIGPARAHAIVTLRERVHQFGHAEDLLRVRGIGRVGFRRMRPYIALAGATTLATRPGHAPRSDDATNSSEPASETSAAHAAVP